MAKIFFEDGSDGQVPAAPLNPSPQDARDQGDDQATEAEELRRQLEEQGTRYKEREKELEELRKEAEMARLTQKVLSGDLSPDEQAEATRKILRHSGWSNSQIEEYMADQSSDPNATPDAPSDTPGEGGDPLEQWFSGTDQKLNQLEQQLQQQQQKERRQAFDKALGDSMGAVMASDEVKKLQETAGEGWPALKERLEEYARESTLKLLQKKAGGGRITPELIRNAAEEATLSETAKLRSAIEGVAKGLGRAPETVTELEQLVQKPAVKAPQWAPEKTRQDVESDVKNWTSDQLARLLAGARKGGNSLA